MSDTDKVQTLPVLPIKHTVLFPFMLMPLNVGRPSSLAATEAALASEGKDIVVVAQRDASIENPSLTDLYSIGTRAVIKQMARKSEELLEVVLLGVERVVLIKLEQHGNYQRARIKPLPLPQDKSPEIEALHREITELAARALALIQPQAAEELRRLIAGTKDSLRLVYTLAPMFSLEAREGAGAA